MSPAVLLYGGDVMSWREWCRQALSLEQEPNPTPLMIEFVEASERRQKIRRGFVVATTTAVMLAVIALTTWVGPP